MSTDDPDDFLRPPNDSAYESDELRTGPVVPENTIPTQMDMSSGELAEARTANNGEGAAKMEAVWADDRLT